MHVELSNDTEPRGLGSGGHRVGARPRKVFFRPAWSAGRRHDFPRRHVEVGAQTRRPVAEICLHGALDQPGLPGQGGGGPLQGLYPGLLIGTDDVLPLLGDRWRVLVDRTDCSHLGSKRHGIIRLGVEPVFHSMGL